jgi:RNA polymerase sigma-70 factor (ECF subfamily)
LDGVDEVSADGPVVPAAFRTRPQAFRGPVNQAALLERIRRRDRQALGELFDAYGSYALLVARHITGDDAIAEEAVHEAVLDLWREPDGDGRGDLYSRLLRLVHRRAVALRRTTRAQPDEPNPR